MAQSQAILLYLERDRRRIYNRSIFNDPKSCIKVVLSPSKKFVFINFSESPLKMMKNAFYFMLKALFTFEIITILSGLFGCVGDRLDKKAMVNFKIHDVTDWATIITVHILTNIS